ncbi:MAG: DEAD/DEAH box helicase family protein, partial [Planctomycetaceae bacterium]|nr:DEAD/DEAH box helicase family protein [Planctomycetaceae bacterium]
MNMTSLKYIDIINGIQSLRRQAELKQCPVLGAAGIRAFCYPHQLYVVREVLRDTKIRRLLADEVGLGKTIEALMIMNALRIRNNYKLRVSIVAGSEERAKQWRNEICGRFPYPFWKDDILENGIIRDNKILNLRSNMNVFFDVTGEENQKDAVAEYPEDGFKIIFPQSFDTNKKYLEPERNDLLILDEIHSFSEALLNFLLSRSAEYQNVLVLSATPLLGDEKSRLQLLKMLNPDQAELSDLLGESPQLESVQMLRSRRLDFPKALPQRKPKIRRFEPLENDIKRINKSGNLLREMLENGVIEEENATLFARRATVGGQTLIDRIDDYRNTNRYPEFARYVNNLTELRTLCTPEQGDARLDELFDYLIEFFAEDSSRKIIIAAQDNPTIDYLTKQIRRCLTEVNQKFDILQLRQERRNRDNNEIENDQHEKNIQKNNRSIVEQFWNDKHKILIAHNDARESYNLQIADALVFYSLPWKAIDMEQWLGRISRLGLRKPKTVDIIAIVLRDTIDEKIADIYQSLNIFEHPLDLEKNKSILQEIEKTI